MKGEGNREAAEVPCRSCRQLERAPSVRIGLFVLRTSVMRSALRIYVYLLFL